MKIFEAWLMEYLLNSLWQVPLIFAAAYAASWLAKPAGVRLEHKVWVGALSIAVLLPACNFESSSLDLGGLWSRLLALTSGGSRSSASGSHVQVIFGPVAAHGAEALRLPGWLMQTALGLYACGLAYFAARLGWGVWKTTQLRDQAQPVRPGTRLAARFAQLGRLLGCEAGQLAVSAAIAGPQTVGVRRRVLLLPENFPQVAGEADMDTVLAHELAHMRRHDFAKNLFYELLALPLSYHPVVWLMRARLAGTREMICDSVAAEAVDGGERYAHSLLRLASMLVNPMPGRNLHAIGIFDANIFERRVMNLTRKQSDIRGMRRMLIAAACAVVAFATCASAIALRMDVSSPQAQNDSSKKINVKLADMKLVNQVHPVYPPDAKEARIQGTVVLDVLISKEGVPTDIRVQKGPSELQTSAMDAVRQWRWQPFLLNGDPVEVETTISVVYRLGDK